MAQTSSPNRGGRPSTMVSSSRSGPSAIPCRSRTAWDQRRLVRPPVPAPPPSSSLPAGCNIAERIEHDDPDTYISTTATIATPDVPYGGSFHCATRSCITWSPQGGAHMACTYEVVFTKSCMLKGTHSGSRRDPTLNE